MNYERFAVLIDKPSGVLTKMAPALKKLGFRPVLVVDPGAAVDVIRTLRKLAIVLLNSTALAPSGVAEAVDGIKTAFPELPLIYYNESPDRPVFGANQPDAVLSPPFSPDVVQEHAIELLKEALYPPELVSALKVTTTDRLPTFGAFRLSAVPFLKASRTLLLYLNSMIPITGSDQMSGHLLVSASDDVITKCHTTMFGEPAKSIEVLEDFVGEISNMVAGGIKALIEQQGTEITIGVPTFIRGREVSFRRGIATPTLTIAATYIGDDTEAKGDDLFVELYMERFDPGIFANAKPTELVDSDDMIFL